MNCVRSVWRSATISSTHETIRFELLYTSKMSISGLARRMIDEQLKGELQSLQQAANGIEVNPS